MGSNDFEIQIDFEVLMVLVQISHPVILATTEKTNGQSPPYDFYGSNDVHVYVFIYPIIILLIIFLNKEPNYTKAFFRQRVTMRFEKSR